MAVQSEPQVKSPTTSLALPRELRQQILVEAFPEDTRDADVRKVYYRPYTMRNYFALPRHALKEWASKLSSIHDTISLDMISVLHKWEEKYTREWISCFSVEKKRETDRFRLRLQHNSKMCYSDCKLCEEEKVQEEMEVKHAVDFVQFQMPGRFPE